MLHSGPLSPHETVIKGSSDGFNVVKHLDLHESFKSALVVAKKDVGVLIISDLKDVVIVKNMNSSFPLSSSFAVIGGDLSESDEVGEEQTLKIELGSQPTYYNNSFKQDCHQLEQKWSHFSQATHDVAATLDDVPIQEVKVAPSVSTNLSNTHLSLRV